MSKEDYELQKELEKEQQKDKEKASANLKKDKKKDPKAETEKKDEVKNIVVELNGLEDRIIRLTPNSSNLGSTINECRMGFYEYGPRRKNPVCPGRQHHAENGPQRRDSEADQL